MKSATLDRRAAHPGRETNPPITTRRQDHEEFLLGDYVRDRIDFRVERLAALLDLNGQDKEDLRQDMLLELWRAWRRFNPSVSRRETFVNRVLDRFFKHLLRTGVARQRRETAMAVGFDDMAEGFEPVVNESHAGENDEQGLRELRLDVHAVIARMPPRLQRVCRTLMVYSGREAARRLGIGKSSLYRARALVRRYFEEAGLGEDFDGGGTVSPRLQM